MGIAAIVPELQAGASHTHHEITLADIALMSPPLPKPEPYRAFGSPTANVNRAHSHTAAKFLVDLTQDSDPVTRDSDSDEPVFLGSQASSRPVADSHGGFNPFRATTRPTVIKSYERQLFTHGLGTASQPLPTQRRQQQPAPPQPAPSQPAPRTMPAQFSGSFPARPSSFDVSSSMFPAHIRVPMYPGNQSRNPLPSRPPSGSMPGPNLSGEYNHQIRPSSRSLLNSRSPSSVSTAKPPLDRPATRDSHAAIQITPPSSSRFDTSGQESHSINAMAVKAPKRTPQKVDWTVDKLVDALHERSVDVRMSHQDLVAFTLRSVQPREQRVMTGVDWFAGVSHDPVSAETDKTTDMLKIRIKVRPVLHLATDISRINDHPASCSWKEGSMYSVLRTASPENTQSKSTQVPLPPQGDRAECTHAQYDAQIRSRHQGSQTWRRHAI